MEMLERVNAVIYNSVLDQIVPEFTRCMFTKVNEEVTIPTTIGDFVYVPYSDQCNGWILKFKDKVVFTHRGVKSDIPYDPDRALYRLESLVKEPMLNGNHHNFALRKAIDDAVPASAGKEKVEVDYTDVIMLISLIKAMAPGELPSYVDRVGEQADLGIKIKISDSLNKSVLSAPEIANVKRLLNIAREGLE